MSPDASSTRIETLQNSLVGRRGVSGSFCWSSGEEILIPGTVANLTVRGRTSKAQECGSLLKQVKQPVFSFVT